MNIIAIIIIFVIIPLITGPLGFPFGVFFNLFYHYRKNKNDDLLQKQFEAALPDGYKKTAAEITSGKLKLTGEFFDFGFSSTVILVPGYRNSPYLNFAVSGHKFIENGYNILITHQRAYGDSQGKFCGVGLREQYDLLKWIDWVNDNTESQHIVIYGVSMGASTVAYASDKIKNKKVKALFIDSAYSSFYELLELAAAKQKKIVGNSVLKVALFLSKKILKLDIKTQIYDSLCKNEIPAVFLAGAEDTTVPVSFLEKAYYNNSSEKELIVVPEAVHIKGFETGGEETQKKIFNFLKKAVKSNG